MRKRRGVDANIKFLFGSVFFFFIIIIVIGLFSYFTLQQYWDNPEVVKKTAVDKMRYAYSVSFAPDFKDKAFSVYLNDSLLYMGTPVNPDTTLYVQRLANENSLLVVNNETDIVTIVELGRHGDVLLKYNNGSVSYRIKE